MRTKQKTANDYLRDALRRVETAKGMAPWPNYNTNSNALMEAWSRAHRMGWVRILEDDEVDAWTATRRGVRAALLAMLERSATDESVSPVDCFKEPAAGALSVLADRLEEVAFDIWGGARQDSFFTLTESGAAKLAELERD